MTWRSSAIAAQRRWSIRADASFGGVFRASIPTLSSRGCWPATTKRASATSLGGANHERGRLSAQHGDCGDDPSGRARQRRADHRLYAPLQALRAHLQSLRSSFAASSRSPGCRASGSGCALPSIMASRSRQQRAGLQPYPLRRRDRDVAPDDRCAAVLHRAGDVLRADQARDADPGPRRAVRGRASS